MPEPWPASKHALLPPSSAGIWGSPNGCRGWPAMAARYPDEDNEDAREGEAAHELGATLIQGDQPREIASNGVVITEEIRDSAELYADNVLEMAGDSIAETPHTPPTVTALHIEQTIRTPIHKQCWGTPDAVLWLPERKLLVVWDYKHGHGVVEEHENQQLICYAAGAVRAFGITRADVELRVVQPRAYHRDGPIRTWRTSTDTLLPYVERLQQAAAEADCSVSAPPDTRSGPHCRYCSARHACVSALEGGWQLYEAVRQPTPVDLSPPQLGLQLANVQRARKQLEYLETALEQQVDAALRRGERVPGWTLAPGRTRLAWGKSDAEVIKLGELFDVDLAKPPAAITPTQAAKTTLNPELLTAYTHTPTAATKLTQDDGSLARRIFA